MVSQRVRLIQERQQQVGVLIFDPVFEGLFRPDEVAAPEVAATWYSENVEDGSDIFLGVLFFA